MKQLAKRLKKVLDDEIIDIIIFGSYTKGSIHPNDLDIAIIAKHKIDRNKISAALEKSIDKKIHLHIVTIEDYDKFLFISLIREGYSVKHRKYLYEVYRIKPAVLFHYSLKSLTASQKVMFTRGLHNFKGIEKIANRVVLVPIDQSDEFLQFLKQWNIDIESRQYGLLPLVRQEF